MRAFNGVKIFSATLRDQRQLLGEEVTRWLEDARARRPGFEVVDVVVTQSSDEAFHCISLVLFFRECMHGDFAIKERLPNAQTTRANVGTSLKVRMPTNDRMATSNASAAAPLPTSASVSAPKKHQ